MKKALIFGATGQDSSYLAELLLGKGYEVTGVRRRTATPNLSNIEHLDCFKLVEGDITDPHSVNCLIGESGADEIYNLAAQSHVATSFEQPAYTCQVNYCGVLNILEAIRRYSPKARFYQASSSEMFGSNFSYWGVGGDGKPLQKNANKPNKVLEAYPTGSGLRLGDFQNEDTPFSPNSPYAIAKLAAHNAVRVYRESYGLHLSCGILFNHESERRGEAFVTRKISKYVAKQLFMEERGATGMSPIRLGNLDAKRDWGHAEDYVRGMWLMLQRLIPDDYVLATGQCKSVRDFLAAALAAANLKGEPEDYVLKDKSMLRPCEVPHLCGDYSKAKQYLGWEPTISFESLVARMVHSDVEQERRNAYRCMK